MRALISAHDLLSVADDVLLLDVQWNLTTAAGRPGRDLYAAEHLPGARFLDLDRDLAGPPGAGGRHPLPDPAALEAALQHAGAEDGRTVVVYDQGPSYAAARAWWVLRHVGLVDVRVLDGGLAAWKAAGGPTTSEVPDVRQTGFTLPGAGFQPLDATGAAQVAREGILLDARAPERFRGESEPIDPVAGRIPGAVNVPTTELGRPDGTFLSPAEVRGLFSRKGIDFHGQRVGVYCGSGVTAAHEVLALHEVGVDAELYVGSWSDWITDPGRPVATGA
jgi:thiosulfate/3-mercaptopyruvate sulfurtransferase